MTINKVSFKSLGFTGVDIRHIAVRVYPYAEVINGKMSESFRVYTGEGLGNYPTGNTTDFIFASMDEEWVFHEFVMGGVTWEGVCVYPIDGDFSVSFASPARRAVIVKDACKKHFTHRYQIIMKNIKTGELATNDPMVANEDQEHT
jgi:hypothetical protein